MSDLLQKVLTDKSMRNQTAATSVAAKSASEFAPWQGSVE